MKTPDSRARFRPNKRSYHRYRETDADGWSRWIGEDKRSGGPAALWRKGRAWIVGALALGALAGLVWLLWYQLL
jgi:hypothetical protein